MDLRWRFSVMRIVIGFALVLATRLVHADTAGDTTAHTVPSRNRSREVAVSIAGTPSSRTDPGLFLNVYSSTDGNGVYTYRFQGSYQNSDFSYYFTRGEGRISLSSDSVFTMQTEPGWEASYSGNRILLEYRDPGGFWFTSGTSMTFSYTSGGTVSKILSNGSVRGRVCEDYNPGNGFSRNRSFGYVAPDCPNSPPVIGLHVSPSNGVAPLGVTFDFSLSSDPDNNIVRSEVDADGDGVYETIAEGIGNVTVDYPDPGVFLSNSRVIDGYGVSAMMSIAVTVWGEALTADLQASETHGPAPLAVVFSGDNSATVSRREIVAYEMDFDGDGVYDAVSTTGLVPWIYRTPGSFDAVLRVTDDQGVQDTDSVRITVGAASGPPGVTLHASAENGVVPLDVVLSASATDDGSIAEYRWDFDGNGEDDLVTGTNWISHTYTDVGTFNAAVTVIDLDGLSSRDVVTIRTVESTDLKVWITSPPGMHGNLRHIWGDAVSLIGRIAPVSEAASVQFEYKHWTSTNWLMLGQPVHPVHRAYVTTWDVTALEDGEEYDLRAVAALVPGQVTTSVVYSVVVDSGAGSVAGGIVEWASGGSGSHEYEQKMRNSETAAANVYDGTRVMLPAGTTPVDTAVRIEIMGTNTHPAIGSAEHLAHINANRKVSLVGGPPLEKAATVILPYDDDDDDGIVDGTSIPEDTLSAHWYDAGDAEWKRALSAEVHRDSNEVRVKACRLTEFGLFGTKNLLSPARGGILMSSTSASSGGTGAANLTDGNRVSYWRSGEAPGEPQGFVYRFAGYDGAVCAKAVLYNYDSQSRASFSRDYEILLSMDGTNWTSAANGTLPESTVPFAVDLASNVCRQLKLVISSGSSSDGWELAELELHGALTADPDSDGMDDAWEMGHFGRLDRDGHGDYDGDALSDINEFIYGANPTTNDTDGDMMPDSWEVEHGLQVAEDDADADADGDGLSNAGEYVAGADPTNSMLSFEVNAAMGSGPWLTNVYWDGFRNTWVTSVHMSVAEIIIEWSTITGRVYHVKTAPDLRQPWATVAGPYEGDGNVASFTNSTTNAIHRFYRLSVELE
jgi:hypothetical protein